MTNETNDLPKSNSARIDASRAAIAQKTNRLPPGEHIVELRARAMPGQMVLRIVAASPGLDAGTKFDLDRLFGPLPPDNDLRGRRAYDAQGSFWLGILTTCGIADEELLDVSLEELAEKINGKQAIAIVNDAGYWTRVRPI
jgi:hypothetical protein